MALPTLDGLERQKRRWDQQCDYEPEPLTRSGYTPNGYGLDRSLFLDNGLNYPVQSRGASHDPSKNNNPGGAEPQTARWQLSPAVSNLPFTSPRVSRLPSLSLLDQRDDGLGGAAGQSGEAGRGPSAGTALLRGSTNPSNPSVSLHDDPGSSLDEISLPAAASCFQTYFTVIHPQYPFLDMNLCSEYYTAWKDARPNGTLVGWPAFFVRMIFALGSLIESKSNDSPYFEHQNLKSTAQAEQSIMTDSNATPLVRLQAMLLSAMFALHAENTWRIAHISGAIMKFAALHRFHRLSRDMRDAADSMAIRVWSCAYILDRAISTALGTPVSLPDMYISSPLCEAIPEAESPVPWLSDVEYSRGTAVKPDKPDLRTFAHICKIRAIQSFFMHMCEKDDLEESIPLDLEMLMLQRLREWEDTKVIEKHSVPGSVGYRSPVWLQHIGHLTRLSICAVNRSNIFTSVADNALQAGCDSCISFRSLQKKKQIAQPWLVILAQFRAAMTLWYIVWARAIPVPREVNDALRDCSAVLAIFAERWPKAEQYRDCFELLAAAIPRSQPLGQLSDDVRQRLAASTRKLEESGIHRTSSRMLWEMCADRDHLQPM